MIIGLCVGELSQASALYTPCEKPYIDPCLIDLHNHKIEVESGEEKTHISALYSDESGIYFQDFLEQEEKEEELEECFNVEDPIDYCDETEVADSTLETPKPQAPPPKNQSNV